MYEQLSYLRGVLDTVGGNTSPTVIDENSSILSLSLYLSIYLSIYLSLSLSLLIFLSFLEQLQNL